MGPYWDIGSPFNWDKARVRLGELAASLDDALTYALSVHYGREDVHILSLTQDVFWRLPVEVRLGLLDDALWRTDLHDRVPFLVPCLRAIFRIRHLLAHGISFGGLASDSPLQIQTVKRGKIATRELAANEMIWALKTAGICGHQFNLIEARIGDIDRWADALGFNDRRLDAR